jgi:hypothetical protein
MVRALTLMLERIGDDDDLEVVSFNIAEDPAPVHSPSRVSSECLDVVRHRSIHERSGPPTPCVLRLKCEA